MSGYALGLIETRGLVGAIEACDAAAKSAQVTITSAEVTDGGLVALKIEGDLAAVRAAVDSGARAAERIGELITAHVIPRPDENLTIMRAPTRFINANRPPDERPPLSHGDDPVPVPPPAPRPTGPARPAPKPPRPKPTPQPKPPAPATPTPTPTPAPAPSEPEKRATTLGELQKMSVVKLRQFARTVENLPIQGRQISMANKTQLIEALTSVMNLE